MQNILYNTHIWAVSFIRSLKFLFARVKYFSKEKLFTLRFENFNINNHHQLQQQPHQQHLYVIRRRRHHMHAVMYYLNV